MNTIKLIMILLETNKKISVDWDGTGSTERGKKLIIDLLKRGNNVYIITARSSKEGIINAAKRLGISENKVIATGSNLDKVKKIKELNIDRHIDNNPDVIKKLKEQNIKATLF